MDLLICFALSSDDQGHVLSCCWFHICGGCWCFQALITLLGFCICFMLLASLGGFVFLGYRVCIYFGLVDLVSTAFPGWDGCIVLRSSLLTCEIV